MTTDPQPSAAPAPTATEVATDAVFRTALRDMLVLLGVTAVLGVGVGVLVAGTPGAWGALIGVGLVLVFSGTTILSMLRTAHSDPQVTAAVVLGAWLGKIVVVIALLAVLRGMDFYSRGVLAVVVAVGVIGSALLDFRAVSRGRVPYVEPAAGNADSRPGQSAP
ncbi:hypothetical protein ACGIF2_08910 [Cellulomonas sp. P22]|uniref:hypothetical protein n=1 Tax=Cellulomonas sp. P22 TaxID=3373189 RepID=UPI0037B64F45